VTVGGAGVCDMPDRSADDHQPHTSRARPAPEFLRPLAGTSAYAPFGMAFGGYRRVHEPLAPATDPEVTRPLSRSMDRQLCFLRVLFGDESMVDTVLTHRAGVRPWSGRRFYPVR
jgi:hypothetical protein